jgi:ABC-type histidine transport system ATPase subunit
MIHQYYANVLKYSDNTIIHLDFPEFEKGIVGNKDDPSIEFEEDIYQLIQNGFNCSMVDLLYKIQNATDEFILYLELGAKQRRRAVAKGNSQIFHDSLLNELNKYLRALLSMEVAIEGIGAHSELIWKHHDNTIAGDKGIRRGLQEYLSYMSPGERNLFYMVLFMCCFYRFFNEQQLIIIMDEPELHLHTEKIRKFIELLDEEFREKDVTFWIATHSIHLIPDFRYSEIVFLDKGKLVPRNSGFLTSIYEIMQGPDRSLKILLDSINKWEYYNFIQECFERPKTVLDQNKKDPQFKAFIGLIQDMIKSNDQIQVLDYGSGQGRFGYYLEDWKSISYYTFDEYLKDPENSKRHFHTVVQLMKNEKQFQCVLLVNTLHEISIEKWMGIFEQIEYLLSDNGFLFFCEAAILTEGEFPYDNCGYLVLGKEGIQALFGENAYFIETNPKIFAAGITKEQLKEFVESGEESRNKRLFAAVESIETISFEKVEQLYQDRIVLEKQLNEDKDENTKEELKEKQSVELNEKQNEEINERFREESKKKIEILSRKYGFYSQLHINAKIEKQKIKISDDFAHFPNAESLHINEVDFENKVNKELSDLNDQQKLYFAWLCTVRALPFLFIDGNAEFWRDEKKQEHLCHVLYALDIAYLGYVTKINGTDVGNDTFDDYTAFASATYASVRVASNAVRTAHAAYVVTYAASAAVRAASATSFASSDVSYSTYVTRAATQAADAAQAAAHIAARVAVVGFNVDSMQFRSIILDDIKHIKENNYISLYNNKAIYHKAWDNFHTSLENLGCAYWSQLYKQIFEDHFILNIDELKRRIEVPDEIKSQGAAAVGEYLSNN